IHGRDRERGAPAWARIGAGHASLRRGGPRARSRDPRAHRGSSIGMSDPKALAQRAIKAIDERRDALFALSRAIHAKPELAYEEREAALRITEFLEGAGFAVERGYKDIETSYRGNAKGRGPGPTVAILQEYDALAEIGHACGHNLIAMIGVAAGMADLGERVVLLEEGDGRSRSS